MTVAARGGGQRLQWVGYVSARAGRRGQGPILLVLCGLTPLVSIAASSELRHRLLALHCVLGLAIVVLLSAPPFVYHYMRFGQEHVTGYVLDENVLLFTTI